MRKKLNEISVESTTKKLSDREDNEATSSPESYKMKREFILPEDIHFLLETSPASMSLMSFEKVTHETGTSPKHKGKFLSWNDRSNLATEGQCAVYRFVKTTLYFLISNRERSTSGK